MMRRAIWLLILGTTVAAAQDRSPTDGPWSVHTQSTYVYQWHDAFPSPYQGPNSFRAVSEADATFSASLYVGRSLWRGAAVYGTAELFQGYALSSALGLGAFPNGEAIKAGFANLHYNTSRLYVQQVIGLGGPTEAIDEGPDQVAQVVDINRITVTIGEFAGGDFFDGNAYSQDSRSQFLNWALLACGAWDEPGDVLGFTAGAMVEWNTASTTLHYGWMMEPTETGSARLDHHVAKAFGQALQYDIRYALPGNRSGTLRSFVFLNRARMGSFAEAVEEAPAGRAPDITATRAYRWKSGAGLSWDQSLSLSFGVFARLSWNEGRNEDIAFSDIDRSIAAGMSVKGSVWGRPDDVLGFAGADDGLSAAHRRYLARGGVGFLLGDGRLNYGAEEVLEAYYSLSLFGHLAVSPDWQYVEHPGYNRDRGGLSVYAVRAHVAF